MEREQLCTRLAQIVSPMIGHTIGEEHIHTDEEGWFYYIPEKSLQEKHPLIMSHYRGPLFMAIPYLDWKKLQNEEISVENYVEESTWSFGYYWGGGSMLEGVKWMPFEDKGIHDTDKISRYLRILMCRTAKNMSRVYSHCCISCPLQTCPMSYEVDKYKGASWENEIRESDDRVLLYDQVKERLEKQFGLKEISCMSHKGEGTIQIFPYDKNDTVWVYLPQKLLIDMLYNPGKYNILETANSLKFEVGILAHYENGEFIPTKTMALPENANIHMCYEFWRKEGNYKVKRWFS